MTGAAAGAVRNFTSALAASACFAPEWMPVEKKHGHPLQVPRQRADVVDAGEMHQLADLLEVSLLD